MSISKTDFSLILQNYQIPTKEVTKIKETFGSWVMMENSLIEEILENFKSANMMQKAKLKYIKLRMMRDN